MTVWRILQKAGIKKMKPTRKPRLTKEMRAEKLKWCLNYKDQTLKDQIKVIQTNETAVVVGYRRRGYRVWRTLVERHLRSCTRERQKGFTEFMFQASYCYDFKGPCHIWKPETTAERKLANKDLKKMNKAIKPICKAKWELNNPISRLRINWKNPSRIPQQRWTKANSKLTRGNGKGINQYRYQK